VQIKEYTWVGIDYARSLIPRRSYMNRVVEIIQETRKEWSAPELKKIDIEQITAAQNGFVDDGNNGGS